MSGWSHGSPVGDSDWYENDQSARPAACATSGGRLQELVLIGIALVEDAGGEAVRREDDVRLRAADAPGQESDEPRVVVPALDEGDLRTARDGLLELLPVAADRQARVVGREHEPGDARRPARERSLGRLGDPGCPVLHPCEDGEAELGLQRGPDLLGDRVQRVRALDPEPAVALGELLDQLRPHRPSAADVGVVGGHVGQAVRRAVRHEDDRGAHATASSSVHELGEPSENIRIGVRENAVAEVEDVPMAAAGSRQHLLGAAPRPASTGRAEPPGRGCPARPSSGPTAAQPSSSVTRQSRPIASPPVAAIGAEQMRRARAEVDRRHVRRHRGSASSTARRTPGSRRPRARRPRSRRAGSRPRRRRPVAPT